MPTPAPVPSDTPLDRLRCLAAERAAGEVANTDLRDQIPHDAHPRIGRATLEPRKATGWIVFAVVDHNAWHQPTTGSTRLTDVLIAATSLVPCVFYGELPDGTITAMVRRARAHDAGLQPAADLDRAAEERPGGRAQPLTPGRAHLLDSRPGL